MNSELSISTSTPYCVVISRTLVCVVCVMWDKADVMFDDIIADVQGVQISGCGASEPALHSCPVYIAVCPAPAPLDPLVPALSECKL